MTKKTLIAVDVIVENNGKILLAKRNFQPFKGKFEIPGGFVEEGESVEQSNIRKCSLAIAFVAETDVSKFKKSNEARELKWLEIEQINEKDLAYDHGTLFEHYKDWLVNQRTRWMTK